MRHITNVILLFNIYGNIYFLKEGITRLQCQNALHLTNILVIKAKTLSGFSQCRLVSSTIHDEKHVGLVS